MRMFIHAYVHTFIHAMVDTPLIDEMDRIEYNFENFEFSISEWPRYDKTFFKCI